jgi:leader peptidase (prepilin peptidase)/N-methyltransferase
MADSLLEGPIWLPAGIAGLIGLLVGRWLPRPIVALSDDPDQTFLSRCPACDMARHPLLNWFHMGTRCPACSVRVSSWPLLLEIVTGLLFAAFAFFLLELRCQQTPMIQHDAAGWVMRLGFHLVLLTLMLLATGTDLRSYVIPDVVVGGGCLAGVALATMSGQLQMVPLWIDWNAEILGFLPPEIPLWTGQHAHLHGLTWSLAGLAAGVAITWLVRTTGSLILGREAMGFGDVTLMAMIGSFLGWQPVLIVFLIAPLTGILLAIGLRLTGNRIILPYGPCLCAAATVVLFAWKWIWMFEIVDGGIVVVSVRRLFGDWIGLLILSGIAYAGFVALLGLLRAYRAIPVPSHRVSTEDKDENEEQPPDSPLSNG